MSNYNNEINKIWIEVIKPTIISFSKELGLKHKSITYLEKRIKNIYIRQKQEFINNYMSVDSPNIDRHKISACIVKTIMIVKPLRIPVSSKLKFIFFKKPLYNYLNSQLTEHDYKYILLANEYLALSIATSVIDGFIEISDSKKRLKHQINLPNPFPEEDDDYLLDLCASLYYANAKRINLIVYSNLFFLIEKYSCRKIQCDNIETALQDELKKHYSNSDNDINKYIENTRLSLENDVELKEKK